VKLNAAAPLHIFASQPDAKCVNDIKIIPITPESVATTADAIGVVGTMDKKTWSLTIDNHTAPPENSQGTPTPIVRIMPLCLGSAESGVPLVFGAEPTAPPSVEKPRPKKKSRRH
jgi:hypothetical protein